MQEIAIRKLYLIVFLTGAIVMILELIGSRILAPKLGTSIFIWTSLIGIILGAMSLGYYIGGKLADRSPNLKTFSTLIFIAGLFTFFIIIIKDVILETSLLFGMKVGAIFATSILFIIPGILLGSISPYAVRLAMKKVENSGNTVGNLYAVSTFGSIFGTFLAGFYLIPNFGSTNILYGLSFILMLLSLFVYRNKKRIIQTSFGLFFLFGFSLISFGMVENNYIIDKDSEYNHIQVYDMENNKGEGIRIMAVENFADSGMFLDSDELVFEYSKYYQLDNYFAKNEIKKVVMFGGAAYSVPKNFLKKNKTATIDVVEIDPETTKIAEKYFRLDVKNERLNIFHQDARMFLNESQRNGQKYDAVYGDAFSSQCSLPFHLTTKEAIKNIYDILDNDGIYIVNIISSFSGVKSEFFRSEYKTIKEKFKNVFVFPLQSKQENEFKITQNIIIVATKSDVDIENMIKINKDGEITKLFEKLWRGEIQIDDVNILTDDFAPVNYFALKSCDY
ncbi:MAG: fused MFS/spermidine synthase [Patescibacteria group bacterium]|nr:fused MFS/spermidine synthase [Patescibacteria group bacterium]